MGGNDARIGVPTRGRAAGAQAVTHTAIITAMSLRDIRGPRGVIR
jgi:hypothetical protein